MQTATAPSTNPASAPPRDLIVGEPGSPVGSGSDPRFAQYKVIRRNGAVVAFEPAKITIAMTKAFLAVNGGQGAASARVREQVTQAHRRRRRGADASASPKAARSTSRKSRTRSSCADARRRARSRARLRALSRAPHAGARARQDGKAKGKVAEPTLHVIDNGVQEAARLERLTLLVKESCEGLADVEPDRILKATLKDLYDGVADGGSAQGRGAGRAHADREGPRVLLRHRAPAARRAALRGAGRRSHAARHGGQVRRILPALRQARHQDRPAQRSAARSTT